AGGGLVLPGDAQPATIGSDVVRRAGEDDDLQALEDARARVDRIGAGLDQVVERERRDARVGAERHGDRNAVRARVDVRGESFHAVADVLHRPAGEDRGGAHRHLVVIDVQLDAEAATDVGRDYPNILLG